MALLMDSLHVNCERCLARGPACSDCVISVLLGLPAERVVFDSGEQAALRTLAGSGLLPPLRLVEPIDGPADPDAFGEVERVV